MQRFKRFFSYILSVAAIFCLGIAALMASGGSDLEGPATVPNPLPPATVAKIKRIIVGEYGAPSGDEREVKIIETITDPYRLEKMKEGLSGPLLHKKYRRSFLGGVYHLIFLDGEGKVLAAASYYLTPKLGYVLVLSQDAVERNGRYYDYGFRQKRLSANWEPNIDYRLYAIAFDWHEAIGYTPGW